MRQVRNLHRLSAMALGLFLVAHLTNHIAAIFGIAVHQRVLSALRVVYRQPWVEPVLLLFAFWQVVSGLTLVVRKWRDRSGAVAWLQAISGAYMAFFLVVHTAAVLLGRHLGLDTNFYFAAAGFHLPSWPWFFAPYYFLAIVALFVHVGCALSWSFATDRRHRQTTIAAGFLLAGALTGAILVLVMAGGFYPVVIPMEYLRVFTR
jgi:succinate dehydrogenase/fumarate reductase cytochrome b subunit